MVVEGEKHIVTANNGIDELSISTNLDTSIEVRSNLTKLTLDTSNAHVIVPTEKTVDTINVKAVSSSSLEILGTVITIEIEMENPVRIYGPGVRDLKIVNKLVDKKAEVILSENEEEPIKIEKDKELEINSEGNIKKFKLTFEGNNDIDLNSAKIEVKDSEGNVVENLEELLNGEYDYTVELAGYKKVEGRITINGEDVQVDIDLELDGTILFGIAKGLETDDILFMSKRILEKKANGEPGSQLAVTKTVLLKAYNGEISDQDKGFNFKGDEKSIYIPENLNLSEESLEIGIKVENGNLILGETSMTKELFEKIKNTEGAEKDKPYSITITNGNENNPKTKIAKIEFSLDGDKVIARLIEVQSK